MSNNAIGFSDQKLKLTSMKSVNTPFRIKEASSEGSSKSERQNKSNQIEHCRQKSEEMSYRVPPKKPKMQKRKLKHFFTNFNGVVKDEKTCVRRLISNLS